MNVLVTRPASGAAITAARLVEAGHKPVFCPCLTIAPRAVAFPPAPGAIILTSSQAIAPLPETYRRIPAFCVGDATAGRLREAGFLSVESAGGDARDLFRLIAARRLPGLHLLAVGQRQGLALARQLRAAGFAVLRRAVYSAQPIRALPESLGAALAGHEIGAALFYSAETARAFMRLKPPETAEVAAFALSPAVAATLAGLPWAAIHVAVSPTEADLLALLP